MFNLYFLFDEVAIKTTSWITYNCIYINSYKKNLSRPDLIWNELQILFQWQKCNKFRRLWRLQAFFSWRKYFRQFILSLPNFRRTMQVCTLHIVSEIPTKHLDYINYLQYLAENRYKLIIHFGGGGWFCSTSIYRL